MEAPIDIIWQGPYTLLADSTLPSILDCSDAAHPGIYLWTIPLGDCYLINYVGISSDNVANRQIHHLKEHMSGSYLVYDPDALARGVKDEIYGPADGFDKFISLIEADAGRVISHLRCFSIFFAKLKLSKVELERIESAIIEALRAHGDVVESFLDNRRISRWIPKEDRVLARLTSEVKFLGLRSEIAV